MTAAVWEGCLRYFEDKSTASGFDMFASQSQRVLFVFGFMVALELPYLFLNSVYYLLRRFNVGNSCRIQPLHKKPSAALVQECLINHAVNIPVRLVFLWYLYLLYSKMGMKWKASTLPSVAEVLGQLFISMMLDDTWFYWSHLLLHHKSIYKYIHKQHHNFVITEGYAVDYAHPVKDLMSNTISTLIGPLLLKSHMTVVWLYAFIKVYQSSVRC